MYNDSRKRAAMRYMATLKEIRFRVKPEFYNQLCEAVVQQGYSSVRQFLLAAIVEKMGKR